MKMLPSFVLRVASGLGWCVVGAALAISGLYLGPELRWIRVTQFAWALLGMLTVLYLVYVEIVRLRTICAWCTAFHVLILVMFLVTITQLQAQRPEVVESGSETQEEESVAGTLPQPK